MMGEDLKDPWADVADVDYITLGAEQVEDLGSASVRVIQKDAPHMDFDSVLVCDLAGEPTVIGKEAIQAQGEAHLVPTLVKPYSDVEAIMIPVDDGRMEAADAELIGVNSQDGDSD